MGRGSNVGDRLCGVNGRNQGSSKRELELEGSKTAEYVGIKKDSLV